MSTYVELKQNRDFIEPNFPGYKLCLQELPNYSHQLSSQVLIKQPSNDQYSYKHAKLFSLTNHLIGIEHEKFEETQIVYYMGHDRMIYKVKLDILGLEATATNWRLPICTDLSNTYNATLRLLNNNLAVLSDGMEGLYFINKSECEWRTIFRENFQDPFVIVDCKVVGNFIHLILFNIKSEGAKHLSVLQWVVYDSTKWEKISLKKVESKSEFHGAFFDYNCTAMFVISNNGNFGNNAPKCEAGMKFTWTQSLECASIYIKCNQGAVESEKDSLKIINKENEEILEGKPFGEIDPSLTTWNIRNETMEIIVFKKVSFLWPELIIGNRNGKYLQDEQSVDEINKTLAHLTSNSEAQEVPTKVSSITDQLEECDFSNCSNVIERIEFNDEGVLVTTHEVHFTNEVVMCNEEEKSVAVHQNEDICLYKLQDSEDNLCDFRHCGSLLALGYIRASKQRRKFTVCAPDLSYTVIAENSRHLFLYRQHVDVASGELRNRSSGKRVAQLAQQKVIELPTSDGIVGVQAGNATLFVLTTNDLFAFKIL